MPTNTQFSSSLYHQIAKGIGQIMLQENVISGLLFLAGIFYGSMTMGVAAILAATCSTITARLLRFNKADIDKGLYGFSAALVGVAVIVFIKPVFWAWLFIVMGSILSALIQHFFISKNIPVFTLPFVLVSWLILLIAKYSYMDILVEFPASLDSSINSVDFVIKCFGQVIFQGNMISGLIFFIGVFISSPIAALYGLAGGVLASVISFYFSFPIEAIHEGLFGFNAVLCAIVFAGNQLKDGIWFSISVLLCLMISFFLLRYEITQLTFPFVVASCITLYLKNKVHKLIAG